MADPRFFRRTEPVKLQDLAEIAEAEVVGDADPTRYFEDVRDLIDAGPAHVSFLDNKAYTEAFTKSSAGACIVRAEYVDRAPEGMTLLVTPEPYIGYARIAQHFYPAGQVHAGVSPAAFVDPRSSLAEATRVDAGAVISHDVEIGRGSRIGANSVIGEGCVIGENCTIDHNVTLTHTLVGNGVIIHPGAAIGQDGFGFAISQQGHVKVPQLGRVVIEDGVEIGANTTIDRGAGPDTVIGAGTKIDNLVQIAHNVKIGRGCIIVSQVGISGSTEIGDFVMVGGQAGLTGHLKIGSGSRIAAQSGVMRNLDPGATVGGSPAKPMREWLKEVATLERLVKNKGR